MNKTLKPAFLLFGVATAILIMLLSCDSYGRRIIRLSKVASEYKATLDPNNQILAERIDSTAQKIFFIEPDKEGCGDKQIKNIIMHDYASDETMAILPESGAIEGFEFSKEVYGETKKVCGVKYLDSKVIKDRLFLIIQSPIWSSESTGVFYINIKDNSLHYVESCNEAFFHGEDKITISKEIILYIGWEDENDVIEEKRYELSLSLSDETYAANRKEHKETEERMAEEWKEQEEIRRIEEVKEWIFGTWESSGWDEWLGRYTSYVCIAENTLRLGYNGQDIYSGPYEIDMESHKIIFDRHDGYYTQIGFNPQTKRLEDESGVFRKVSNNASYSSSNSSSYGSGNSNSTVGKLAKLDDEEDKLIREGSNAVRSGRADVALLKVYRMKDINIERIRLARQSGDLDLIQYYEYKKSMSEVTIRSWGFN